MTPNFSRRPHSLFKPSLLKPVMAMVAMLVLLSGCNDQKTRELIDQRADEAQKATADMNNYAPVKHYNPLVVTDKVWAGDTATRMHRGLPLPPRYETDHGVTLVSSEPMSLTDIVAAINTQTGITVRLSDAGISKNATTSGTSATTGAAGAGMPIAYEGPLSGLMEKVAGHFGVNWRYDGSTITVSRYETRVFVIEALPGTQSVSEGMQDDSSSSGSSSSSGGGGSSQSSITQNSKFSIDFKYWDELEQILTAMLNGTGTVVSSPSVGTVTVTTTPETMRVVSDYLAQENKRLSRQIAINVEIYSVSLTEGSDFNIAFNTVLRRLTNFGFNYAGAPAPPTPTVTGAVSGGGAVSVAILNNNFITRPDGSILSPIGQVTDIFTALSGIGDTTKVAKFPLVTLNNRPVSRRVGEDVGYVASSTATNASTTTTGSTSVTPGTIHQGFSVQLTPRLLDDGRILLQYSLSVIDIKAITSFNSITGTGAVTDASTASGSTTIQLPDTINRIFVQQSILKSGSMLLLGGAEEEDLQHNSQGVGDPFFYALGGGTASAKSHTMLFMAITPQVLEEPHSEQD
jgi:type IVB pilus formation R64 PilN family outer membrane protein